jgi:hypothetical protein
MTLPHERLRSVNNTRDFLYDLLDPKAYPRVPRNVREKARNLLRHYPTSYDMSRICEGDSTVFNYRE